MKSNRPYLLRPFYEWIVDSDCTPYIAVDANFPGVEVPQQFVTDGQIVLNIAPRAVSGFEIDVAQIQLSTKFGGIPIDIFIPLGAIMGIYAYENGRGMVFEPENPDDDPNPPPSKRSPVVPLSESKKPTASSSSKPKNKPSLRVIK